MLPNNERANLAFGCAIGAAMGVISAASGFLLNWLLP